MNLICVNDDLAIVVIVIVVVYVYHAPLLRVVQDVDSGEHASNM